MRQSIGAEHYTLTLTFKYLSEEGQANASGGNPHALTAVQAGALAQKLANEKAQSLYGIQPFPNRHPAEFIHGAWAWHDLQGCESGDIQATVNFEADGAIPSVSVTRLVIGR